MRDAATSSERHELSFEEFDLRVSVEAGGDVWVSFHESGKCVFTISTSDLADAVAFVEQHGQVRVSVDDD